MGSASVPNTIIWCGSDAGLQPPRSIHLHAESHHLEQQDQEQHHQEDMQQQQQQQQQQQDQTPAEEQDSNAVNSEDGVANQDTSAGSSQDQDGDQAQDSAKKRCDKCGKKLGLTGGFPCRCGGTYCAVHRYSDRHECNFDYREMGANEIRRDNPVVVASKLRKL
ncbi:zinc finger A20 and AN1 domain-containing stress-associated protein 6 [Drosophila santomea]|uniref:zinc finger A20 and AN1 domain-containing stress-associated protein 6 n=1 Tax=Drosophila santomea TaxID=129105 RepID=UPI001953C8BD|nr:zinc finger A20 and AN1 domain-containing stress-associated protein 6 [Drosophila santomea]